MNTLNLSYQKDWFKVLEKFSRKSFEGPPVSGWVFTATPLDWTTAYMEEMEG